MLVQIRNVPSLFFTIVDIRIVKITVHNMSKLIKKIINMCPLLFIKFIDIWHVFCFRIHMCNNCELTFIFPTTMAVIYQIQFGRLFDNIKKKSYVNLPTVLKPFGEWRSLKYFTSNQNCDNFNDKTLSYKKSILKPISIIAY